MEIGGLLLCLSVLSVPTNAPAGSGISSSAECTCASVRISGGWCGLCKVGYLAGVKLPSASLFEALDAHGHDFDPKMIQCLSCKKALNSDGYCELCRMGFVGRFAYLSRLSYILARGKPRELATLTCEACRKNAEATGWCEACQVGMLGPTEVSNRAEFDRGVQEVERLRAAVALLDRCEDCAVALICDGTCIKCNASYRDGRKRANK